MQLMSANYLSLMVKVSGVNVYLKNVEKYDEYIEGKKRGGAASAAAKSRCESRKRGRRKVIK